MLELCVFLMRNLSCFRMRVKMAIRPGTEVSNWRPGQSPTIPRLVIHHPRDSHPPSPGCSPTISRILTHHTKDVHQSSSGQSITILRMVFLGPRPKKKNDRSCDLRLNFSGKKWKKNNNNQVTLWSNFQDEDKQEFRLILQVGPECGNES